jgi:hypothetical protein
LFTDEITHKSAVIYETLTWSLAHVAYSV